MTEPEPLPGLETPSATASSLERAVRRTIAELDTRGYVGEESAARTALAIELAQIITAKRASGRTSTVGNDARVLVELLDRLTPVDTGVDAKLQAAVDAWTAHLEAEQTKPESDRA